MVITIGEVNHIVGSDVDAVWISNVLAPPGVEVVAVAVEYEDRWVFALESVDAVFGVWRYRTDRTEGQAGGQRAPGVNHFIGELATTNCRHMNSLLCNNDRSHLE